MSSLTKRATVDDDYATVLSISPQRPLRQKQPQQQPQPHPQPPPQSHPYPHGHAHPQPTRWSSANTAKANGRLFKQRPQHHKPRCLHNTSTRRPKQKPLTRTASAGSDRPHAEGGAQRQLSIINAISFVVFLVNVVAAVAVLSLFSQASLTGVENSTSQDWISLAIGDNGKCTDVGKRRCHDNRSGKFLAGDKSIGPLVCSNWSLKTGHCNVNGPTFKLVDDKTQVAIMRDGHYRIHLMATSHEKNNTLKFFIVINNNDWIHCSSNNVTAKSDADVYTRCFITAMRYLTAKTKVAFKCDDEKCTINTFEKITYFGLERL